MTRYDRAHEGDLPTLARLLSLAFGVTAEEGSASVRRVGVQSVRVLRDDQGLALAEASLLTMGQYFGGVSVPMVGVSGVAIDPPRRGRGLAQTLMHSVVREAFDAGIALSALYASTQSLYRKLGFEQAGYQGWTRLPLAAIGVNDHALTMRLLETSAEGTRPDDAAVRELYARWARTTPGMIDRGTYNWRRLHEHRGVTHQAWGVMDESGRPEGYVIAGQRSATIGAFELIVSDLAFATPRAGRRLLTFLADFGTVAEKAILPGGPWSPLLALMPRQEFDVELRDYWMLRITHLEHALTRRGYPPGLTAEFSFDLADTLIPEQAGEWTLRVRDGRGHLERGRSGGEVLCLDTRGLAAIYSGFMTPAQAERAGLAAGPEALLERAAPIFAGPMPTMMDSF